MTVPQLLFQARVPHKKRSCGSTFKNFHILGYGYSRRNAHKKMYVIRLYLFRQDGKPSSGTHIVQHLRQCLCDFTSQNSFSVLWAPYHMVCRLIYTISLKNDIYHVSNFITWSSCRDSSRD